MVLKAQAQADRPVASDWWKVGGVYCICPQYRSRSLHITYESLWACLWPFMLTVFGLLAVQTARTAFRASYILYDDAMEYLVYAHGATGV
jgi:hypothetical protein